MRSSFSSKVIPLNKTRKVRKSPFFAPKTEVFLLLLSRPTLSEQLRPSLLTPIVLTRIALTGPVAQEAGELQRGRSCLKQRCQTMPDPCCTLHSFWLLSLSPHLSISTVGISTSPLLFVLGPSFSASSSFSFFFSRTHTPSFLATLLSPCLNPGQPPLTAL